MDRSLTKLLRDTHDPILSEEVGRYAKVHTLNMLLEEFYYPSEFEGETYDVKRLAEFVPKINSAKRNSPDSCKDEAGMESAPKSICDAALLTLQGIMLKVKKLWVESLFAFDAALALMPSGGGIAHCYATANRALMHVALATEAADPFSAQTERALAEADFANSCDYCGGLGTQLKMFQKVYAELG